MSTRHTKPVPCSLKSTAGFTLIELLVVVAIISVLVALLLPSLQKAMAQSKKVVCASNQRQIAMGLMQYAGDSNGWAPGEWSPDRTPRWQIIEYHNYYLKAGYTPTNYYNFGKTLFYKGGYLKDLNVFACQSRAIMNPHPGYEYDIKKYGSPNVTVPGANVWLMSGFIFNVFMYDAVKDSVGLNTVDPYGAVPTYKVGENPGRPISADYFRNGPDYSGHDGGGINVCYEDGSVSWRQPGSWVYYGGSSWFLVQNWRLLERP